jgi:hypothetical protein
VVARLAAGPAGEASTAGGRGGKPVQVIEMEASVKERVRAFLSEHTWAADSLFDNDAKYEQTRDATLALFTRKELAIHYLGAGRNHTLNELIHMLFDSAANRRRVDAAGFLSPIAG